MQTGIPRVSIECIFFTYSCRALQVGGSIIHQFEIRVQSHTTHWRLQCELLTYKDIKALYLYKILLRIVMKSYQFVVISYISIMLNPFASKGVIYDSLNCFGHCELCFWPIRLKFCKQAKKNDKKLIEIQKNWVTLIWTHLFVPSI